MPMNLPPDIEFHEDIRLLVYRPRGVLNEQSVGKIVTIIGDLEAKLQEPFNRFFDTLGHDEVELNFRLCHSDLSVSSALLRRSPAGEIGDSGDGHHDRPLLPVTRHNHPGLTDQCSNISKTRRRREMARCSAANGCGGSARESSSQISGNVPLTSDEASA